jgi:hypothetical protein
LEQDSKERTIARMKEDENKRGYWKDKWAQLARKTDPYITDSATSLPDTKSRAHLARWEKLCG